jgi:hypothetical protein
MRNDARPIGHDSHRSPFDGHESHQRERQGDGEDRQARQREIRAHRRASDMDDAAPDDRGDAAMDDESGG